jgi:hypothetical protein
MTSTVLTLLSSAELTWGYQPNVEAGEDIRIVSVGPGAQWPVELPERTDFWFFDLKVLYVLCYDGVGRWLGAERVTDPATVERACRWRETALRLAVPWRSYIERHAQLMERLPRGRINAS